MSRTIDENLNGTFQEQLDNFCCVVLSRKLWDLDRVVVFRKTATKNKLDWWERQLLTV